MNNDTILKYMPAAKEIADKIADIVEGEEILAGFLAVLMVACNLKVASIPISKDTIMAAVEDVIEYRDRDKTLATVNSR